MKDALLYGMLIYGVAAFVAAVAAVVVQLAFVAVAERLGSRLLASVPAIALGAGAMMVVLSNRDLQVEAVFGGLGAESSGAAWATRLANLFLLAIAVAKLAQMLFAQQVRTQIATAAQDQSASRRLFMAFLAYAVCSLLLPMVFGTVPGFSHDGLIAVPMFIAAYLGRKESLNGVLLSAKWILLLIALASLALAAVLPKLVVSSYMGGLIPGLPIRLWGLSSHPNVMGGMVASLMLMLWMRPFSRRWLQALAWLVAVIALFLTQSKSSWLAALMAYGTLLIYRHGRDTNGRLHIGVWITLLLGAAVLASGLLFIDIDKVTSRFLDSDVGAGLSTLTGRTRIWQVALQVWLDSPWFGYGPDAWSPMHRMQLGVPYATTAHNQLLQALSEGGLFDAVSMLVYFVLLGLAAVRTATRTRGVSLAFFLVITARCVGEAPFSIGNMTSCDIVLHLILFMMVVNESTETALVSSAQSAHRDGSRLNYKGGLARA